jgi:hypothetical protein
MDKQRFLAFVLPYFFIQVPCIEFQYHCGVLVPLWSFGTSGTETPVDDCFLKKWFDGIFGDMLQKIKAVMYSCDRDHVSNLDGWNFSSTNNKNIWIFLNINMVLLYHGSVVIPVIENNFVLPLQFQCFY